MLKWYAGEHKAFSETFASGLKDNILSLFQVSSNRGGFVALFVN